ncbi:centrosomal protein of 128 kDa-like isoform X2 [Alosa sapidissima]|uniref:centrosomal protein of 128 kDa-like isoform X2 n=1 Tax=Alosa sapidissima TaxID=34773 RepID=UPI001C09199D|nr:centrosomal protein of 128 kDa-like isoform X2 [Alosa sapidissima]
MESSSESETFDRARRPRLRGREPQRRRSRDKTDADIAISEKIDTLASTLQDTSRNLHRVDQMLGQYREHTDDKAEAMATLKESLEESIQQLQSQRLHRAPASHSGSFSTLHSSDLEDGSTSDGPRYCPTSPLKDYGSSEGGSRRRSRSATVRFRDSGQAEDIHSLHQSLRDLRSDQLRLTDDVNREIHRRNRSEVETKRTLKNLNGRLSSSQGDPVSLRVEQRLQEIEKGISSERQPMFDRQRPQMHQPSNFQEVERELEMTRRRLEQSEGGRDTLLQQVEDMRDQLLRTEKERVELQQQVARLFAQRKGSDGREEGKRRDGGRAPGRVERDREVQRDQLDHISLSDLEQLKRVLEHKDREKAQLSSQLEALSLDLQRGEQRQGQLLEQLQQVRSRSEGSVVVERERERAQVQLAESERRREEMRARALEALRQWKGRCRKLERQLQELRAQAKQDTDKAQQAERERESAAQAQLRTLALQAEGARRELAEVLGRLAQREEEVRRGELERQRLERQAEEVRRASAALQEGALHQDALQERLRQESGRLEERLELLEGERQRERAQLAHLQGELRSLGAERAEATGRLAREEAARREAQQKLTELQEELTELGRRLEEEREIHRLHRNETEAHVKELKAEVAVEREQARLLRVKLERMKEECARLTEEQSGREEAHNQLLRKQQALKAELEDKARSLSWAEERWRAVDSSAADLRVRLAQLETELPSILQAVGEHIHTTCLALSTEAHDKLTAISQSPGLQKDPHRWLAETKTKLQWLCEELRERGECERRVRRQLQQSREQLKTLRQGRQHEQQHLLQRLSQHEQQLQQLNKEKRDLQERNSRKDEEMRSLQDRILDLEMSTRLALDHLESVPDKPNLMENFKDLEESQRQREAVEQRYSKYKEIVGDLQNQLEESKRKIQEYRGEKLDATSRSLQLAGLSSSFRGYETFLSSTLLSGAASPPRRLGRSPEPDSAFLTSDASAISGHLERAVV